MFSKLKSKIQTWAPSGHGHPKSNIQPLSSVPMEEWDAWAQQLAHGQLRHDTYIERLLQLPQIFMLGWTPPGERHPRPMPFHNSARQMMIMPVFTGTDALRRFAEIQKLDQPLVIAVPTAEAWTLLASLEIDGITINAGSPAALSCDMGQVMALAEAARGK